MDEVGTGITWGQEAVPEYYADFVKISANLFSIILELGVQGVRESHPAGRPPAKILARVRISPPHAVILAKLLEKNLEAYQKAVGPIPIPEKVYQELGLLPKEG